MVMVAQCFGCGSKVVNIFVAGSALKHGFQCASIAIDDINDMHVLLLLCADIDVVCLTASRLVTSLSLDR